MILDLNKPVPHLIFQVRETRAIERGLDLLEKATKAMQDEQATKAVELLWQFVVSNAPGGPVE